MEYHATRLEVTGFTVSMGRIIKTTIPVPKETLELKWLASEDVGQWDKRAKRKYEVNYNWSHGAQKLPVLPPGTLQLYKWSTLTVNNKESTITVYNKEPTISGQQ